jgi:O-antigen/teichoic acid export membrane protein
MRRPSGFAGLAVCSALFGLAMGLAFLDTSTLDQPVATRAVVAVIAALSLVNAEALWRVRPWAYRASRALAASVVAAIVLAGLGGFVHHAWNSFWLLVIAAICAWGLRPVLAHVRGSSLARYPLP